jgi:hypothetical protein
LWDYVEIEFIRITLPSKFSTVSKAVKAAKKIEFSRTADEGDFTSLYIDVDDLNPYGA